VRESTLVRGSKRLLCPNLTQAYNKHKSGDCMKRIVSVLLLIAMMLTFSSCATNTIKGSVVDKTPNGNAILDIIPQKLMEEASIGNTVIVTIGDFKEEMLFVEELIAEDGKLQLFLDKEDWSISVCIYNGDFCETYGIDTYQKVLIEKK